MKKKWNKIKIQFGFITAFSTLVILSVFIFIGYPEKWQNNYIIATILLSGHIIGATSLSAIFIYNKKISSIRMKNVISYFGSIYYIFMINMSILTIIKFIIKLIYDVGIKSEHFSFIEFLKIDIHYESIGMLISLSIAFIGFINANRTLLKKYNIKINKQSNIKNLKILLISDIHIGSGTHRKTYDKMINITKATNPDMIMIAGDVFDETTSDTDIENMKRFAETLNPQYGKYFVYGNHDLCRPEYTELLKQMGIKILSDEKIKIDNIQIIGRNELKTKHIAPAELSEKLDINTNDPVIVLQHRPNEFLKLDENKYDLVMAGHTHGFNLAQSINVGITSDLIYGKRKYNNITAIVSSGISSWGFHYKFPASSEMVEINLEFNTQTTN